MSAYHFRHWHTRITAAMAEAEPDHLRLFAEAPRATRALRPINRAHYRPWAKPLIDRTALANTPAERK